jgi:hypothetical protein
MVTGRTVLLVGCLNNRQYHLYCLVVVNATEPRKVLQEARQKLELSNLCAVTSVVQVRLTMAMMGCISIYRRNVLELHSKNTLILYLMKCYFH